jgi:purine-binding chemotaxis protein CheW
MEVTPVPLSAGEVTGLINLRGQIVTTLELRTRLAMADRDAEAAAVCVVVRTGDGTPVSLVVDSIGDVLEPEDSLKEAPPETVPASVRPLVVAVCKLPEELLLVLDTELATTVGGAA